MTDKIDLKNTLDSYRAPPGRFVIVDIPDPVAYKRKFASKRELGRDYVVLRLCSASPEARTTVWPSVSRRTRSSR